MVTTNENRQWGPADTLRTACVLLAVALSASTAAGQSVLDRVVGPFRDQPLMITVHPYGAFIPQLSEAAGVPMGFEGAPLSPDTEHLTRIEATGKRVRDVLDAIVAADPRYEWREDAGVIVVRPTSAWSVPSTILDRPVGPVTLENATRDDVLHVVRQMFGAITGDPPLRNVKRISVEIPAETPLMQFLNAVVRAHGGLCWTLTPLSQPVGLPPGPRIALGFTGEPQNLGFGIPLRAPFAPGPYVVSRPPPDPPLVQTPVLERTVGRPVNISIMAAGSLARLADAVGVAMGVQTSSRAGSLRRRPFQTSIALQGLSLREALDALKNADPRFDWHEMNGVIVFRPVESWADPQDPLMMPVSAVTLKGVSTRIAVQHLLAAFGRSGPPPPLADSRTFSIELSGGTRLALLNEVARAHGELTWGWGALNPDVRSQVPDEFQHELEVSTPGSGGGFPIP